MKGWHFALGLVGALMLSLFPLPVLFMAECQLNEDAIAVAACFKNAEHVSHVYFVTLAMLLVLAIALQIRRSKWAIAGLLALAIGPLVAIFLA